MGRQRLPTLKARNIIRVLQALGFVCIRQKGSHAFFQHPTTGQSTVVPVHPGQDIDRSLLSALLREAHIDPLDFIKYL